MHLSEPSSSLVLSTPLLRHAMAVCTPHAALLSYAGHGRQSYHCCWRANTPSRRSSLSQTPLSFPSTRCPHHCFVSIQPHHATALGLICGLQPCSRIGCGHVSTWRGIVLLLHLHSWPIADQIQVHIRACPPQNALPRQKLGHAISHVTWNSSRKASTNIFHCTVGTSAIIISNARGKNLAEAVSSGSDWPLTRDSSPQACKMLTVADKYLDAAPSPHPHHNHT